MAGIAHDCLNHKGVPAAAHCAQCHKPICADCIAATRDDAAFCSEKCFEFNKTFYTGYDDLQPRGRSWVKVAAGLAALLGVLLGLLYAGRALGFEICDRVLRLVGL